MIKLIPTHILRSLVASLLASTLFWVGTEASAQEHQFSEKATDEAPDEDKVAFAVAAGGLFSGGNTRSWTLNVGSSFSWISGPHAFGAAGSFAYGRASLIEQLPDGTFARRPWDDTTRNALLGLRYDYFLTKMDAVFVAAKWRWDTFAGLDTRLQGQIGYLRNLFKTDKQRFWLEIGYDITYDNYDPDPFLNNALSEMDMMTFMCADPNAADPHCYDDEDVVHAARIYVGYTNDLYENIQFAWGTEVLLNLENFEDVRVNLDLALRASLVERLQVEMKYRMLFDNVPVPPAPGLGPRAKADHQFSINLVYNIL